MGGQLLVTQALDERELLIHKIMDKIKEMFTYTEIHLKSGDWNAYNDMNEKIIRCMRGQSI